MKHMIYRSMWALVLAFFMTTCSGGGGGGGTPLLTSLPAVRSTSPAAGAVNVATNTAITAEFSGEMDAATINGVTFTLNNGITGAVTYDATNNIAKFAPSGNLAFNTNYSATLTTGVRDLAGNAMANNFVWSFTTGSVPDTTPPLVKSATPSDGALSVPINISITAVFSEAMDAATINGTTFTLSNGVIGAITYDAANHIATFAPSDSLASGTTFTATISTGVRDLAGNAMVQDFIWSFTTGIMPLPPGPPLPPSALSAPQQAATTFSAVFGAKALMDAQFSAAMALGQNSLPAGFAPGLSGSSSGDIGSIDPTLASIVEDMQRLLRSAAVQGAVKKAGALKAQRVPISTTLTTEFCSNADGNVTINGNNNYDEVGNPSVNFAYDLTFTKCRDDIGLTQLDGLLHIVGVQSTDNDATTSSLTATNLTEKQFSSAIFDVMTQQSVLNGSFVSDNQVVTTTKSASSSFVVTTPAGAVPEKVTTLAFTGFVEESNLTHNADASDTNVTTSTGTVTLRVVQGGTSTFQLTLGISLEDRMQVMNDAAGTTKDWINGTMNATWAPDLSQTGCKSGSLTFLTDTAAPRTFTSTSGLCPVSGTVMVNDATITYGIPVLVTMSNGDTQSFADCTALNQAGAACLP